MNACVSAASPGKREVDDLVVDGLEQAHLLGANRVLDRRAR
jgi:hypothetical protein